MNKFRFLEWTVYKDSKNLLVLVLSIIKKIPKEYRYEIGSQIIRAALSIVLNIAEGSGKSSDKEMGRFFEIALGSVYETLAGFDILRDNKLINDTEFNEIHQKLFSISSQLGGFKKKLNKSHN